MGLKSYNLLLIFKLLLVFLSVLPHSMSQTEEAPSPAANSCNGVFLSYTYSSGTKLKPTDPTHQPYRFESVLTVLNNGDEKLKSWRVFVGFKNDELLVSASNAVLADGTSLPANVGNGTHFAGYPMSDLKTAIETAGDLSQMQVQVKLVGTQFGVAAPDVPLPENIELANDGFVCPTASLQGKNNIFLLFYVWRGEMV